MPDARASGPVIVDSADLDEIATRLERCDTELIQLGGGPMHLNAVLLPLGFMYVASVRAGCAVVLRGAVPNGGGLVLQSSPASVPLRIGSQSVVGDACIFARSRAQLAIYLPENCSAYAFCVSTGAGESTGRSRAEIRMPAPEHLIALRECIALLDSSKKELRTDRGTDIELRRRLQELLLPAASSLWAHASAPIPQPSGRIVRVCAVMRACTFIDLHLNRPLTLNQLCDAAGVRPRTLEYGFRECYDIGPMTYLRSVRLCRVRRELSKVHSCTASVADAAHKWCFTHMGQFGRDYRLLFGEAPSMTLARARRSASQLA